MIHYLKSATGKSQLGAAPVPPTPPLEADIDQAGYVTPQITNVDPWQAIPLPQQSMALKQAAIEGAGICEICEQESKA